MKRGSIFFENFHSDDYQISIELSDDGTIWMTMREIAALFNVAQSSLEASLKTLFKSDKLVEERVKRVRVYRLSNDTQYFVDYYNLEVIIALSFRIESYPCTLFRQWIAQQICASLSESHPILGRLGTTAMMN
ncbi:hypothetical protein [Paludibacter sp.]|uniref:hypothetical protein n=1 Tax=Paludibacter sp. TaxID=1898105 RepID=UPI001354E0F2|nr:hypothetical protein [Paludibacter sp.]MTK53345.1 hypothetical protein [Paludibacter sp.]